jgi:hypothetical protein
MWSPFQIFAGSGEQSKTTSGAAISNFLHNLSDGMLALGSTARHSKFQIGG